MTVFELPCTKAFALYYNDAKNIWQGKQLPLWFLGALNAEGAGSPWFSKTLPSPNLRQIYATAERATYRYEQPSADRSNVEFMLLRSLDGDTRLRQTDTI